MLDILMLYCCLVFLLFACPATQLKNDTTLMPQQMRIPQDELEMRTPKEEFLRSSAMELYAQKTQNHGPHEYAVMHEIESGEAFFGGRAKFNLWKPYVEQSTEFSLAQIWIFRRTSSSLNVIEAGWHVYPRMYNGDRNPRFFIFYTNDHYRSQSGCYNLQCPGFTQINFEINLWGPITRVSEYNGEQVDIRIEIYKDLDNLWWLKVKDVRVGYWQAGLFPALEEGASEIQWGGEVINERTGGEHTTTHMGSGHSPAEGLNKASYISNLEVMGRTVGDWKPPKNRQFSITNPNCYDMIVHQSDGFGTYFFYGGFGRNIGCP